MGGYDFYYCSVYCNEIKLISIFVSAQESEKHNIYYIHNGQQRP